MEYNTLEKRFELRQGERVLARLTKSKSGDVILRHDLTEDELSMLPVIMPFDESGTQLKVQHDDQAGKGVSFSDSIGKLLRLGEDDIGLLNVTDTKGRAGLRTKLIGSGSDGNEPLKDGYLVLELGPFSK